MLLYSNNKRPGFKKKNSKMGVIRNISLKKNSNLNVGSEEKEKNMKRSNPQLMDEKR